MEITIESPHFTVTPELNDYIQSKAGKLEHLNERLILCEVALNSTNHQRMIIRFVK